MASVLQDYIKSSKEKASSKSSLLSDASSGLGLNSLSKSVGERWSAFTGNSAQGDQEKLLESSEEADGWFTQAKTDPCLPSLSKKQRIVGFMLCLSLGLFCFFMCSLYLPLLLVKARKFALLYTLGSLFFLMSFSALWGPVNHLKHLFSGDRLPFTIVYFLTIGATLYFSMWKRSFILTIIFAVIQILAMVWYIISYIPGGQTGLKFFYKIFYAFTTRTASAVLPV
ncbi:uncharacterized protein [Watersipora subatra]|uniref:uncharacterized protein n=1 Tax=Watersipora subatra TaxID=2589382 RepID=UPI00355B52C0